MENTSSDWALHINESAQQGDQSKMFTEPTQNLSRFRCSKAFCLWVVRSQEKVIREKVGPLLGGINIECHSDQQVLSAISGAHQYFINGRSLVSQMEKSTQCTGYTRKYLLRTLPMLYESLPPRFDEVITRIFERQLQHDPQGSSGKERTRTVCNQLVDLGFSAILEEAISRIAFDTVDHLVRQRAEHDIETRAIPDLIQWMNNFLENWMKPILPSAAFDNIDGITDTNSRMNAEFQAIQLKNWKKRLFFRLHESMGNIRRGQLMQLIKSFPRSLPALEDLKDCISSTDQKPEVTKAMRIQFTQAMLNAGIVTSEILQQYVNVIRMLRFLDSSGAMLENVSGPVRDYLRRRPDTVRCIVSGMTGDGDLFEELQRGRGKRLKDADGDAHMSASGAVPRKAPGHEDEDCQSIDGYYDANLRVEADDYNNWEPEPIDAPPRDGKWKPGKDAIATLITIYGSSEQIVNEYKGLLADKLVNNFDLSLDREYKILELLTERFGKEAMHECRIMLNDIKDSKEIENKRDSGEPVANDELANFEAFVISKEFWPKLPEESRFQGTAQMEHLKQVYEASFKKHKHPRKLKWQHGMGTISVHLKFEDSREIKTAVTPIQAAILSQFAEKKQHKLEDLQRTLNIEDGNLFRRKIQGLASLGIIRAADSANTLYETIEYAGDIESTSADIDDDDGHENDTDEGEEQAEDEQMMIYEKYVIAMLQNLKQLPLEQIHTMLQRFVQSPAYDRTQSQLASLLTQLVNQGKIEISAGMYRIKK